MPCGFVDGAGGTFTTHLQVELVQEVARWQVERLDGRFSPRTNPGRTQISPRFCTEEWPVRHTPEVLVLVSSLYRTMNPPFDQSLPESTSTRGGSEWECAFQQRGAALAASSFER